MAVPRYLCSHLVQLLSGDSRQWVNLSEIWETGAMLECEERVVAGTNVRVSAGDICFPGTVTAVEQHEFGWAAQVEFSPATPWTIERWQPEHMFNPASLPR